MHLRLRLQPQYREYAAHRGLELSGNPQSVRMEIPSLASRLSRGVPFASRPQLYCSGGFCYSTIVSSTLPQYTFTVNEISISGIQIVFGSVGSQFRSPVVTRPALAGDAVGGVDSSAIGHELI